jgi:hypothetical protein
MGHKHASSGKEDAMSPAFTTTDGRMTLFELFEAVQSGKSVELLHMQPHQRGPVVTALAVVIVALRRYAAKPPASAAEWEQEWMRQVGADALRILAPETEVGFFQPPLDAGTNRSEMAITDIDLVFAKLAHAVKPVATADAERAVFALLSGAWATSVVKWTGGSRQTLSVVLPSDDGSLAGETRHLAMAYEASPSALIGSQASASSAAEHFVWMRPVSDSGLTQDMIPWPYQEARPIHLVQVEPGRFAGTGQHSAPRRIAGSGHADDPHVALIDGSPYRLWGGRVWSMRSQHELLFGSERTTRPRTLHTAGYQAVRVCALGVDQGKTLGYWEAFYPLTQKAAFSLVQQPARAADLSQRALDAAKEVDGALRWAVDAIVQGSGASAAVKANKGRAAKILGDLITEPLTAAVLSLLGQPSDAAAEQQALLETATTVLRRTWMVVATGSTDPLSVAEGTARIEARIHTLTGDRSVHEFHALEKQVFAILNDVASHLTPDDKATLRTMLATEPPMLYWTLLGQVHASLMNTRQTEAVWRAVLPALGTVRLKGLPVGKALAQTDYPEMRMRQALIATGSTLVSLLTEIVRWLVAHEVRSVDVSSLATLGLADALGNRETLAAVRQRIALDYVRSRTRREAA